VSFLLDASRHSHCMMKPIFILTDYSYKQESKKCRKSSNEDPTTVPRVFVVWSCVLVFVVWSCVLVLCHVRESPLAAREGCAYIAVITKKYSLQKPLCTRQNGFDQTASIVMESLCCRSFNHAVAVPILSSLVPRLRVFIKNYQSPPK
jgi:hypothetical protein